jgi:hypothetical protein
VSKIYVGPDIGELSRAAVLVFEGFEGGSIGLTRPDLAKFNIAPDAGRN